MIDEDDDIDIEYLEYMEDKGIKIIAEYLDEFSIHPYEIQWMKIEKVDMPHALYKFEITYEAFDIELFRTIRDSEYTDRVSKEDFIRIARQLSFLAKEED